MRNPPRIFRRDGGDLSPDDMDDDSEDDVTPTVSSMVPSPTDDSGWKKLLRPNNAEGILSLAPLMLGSLFLVLGTFSPPLLIVGAATLVFAAITNTVILVRDIIRRNKITSHRS